MQATINDRTAREMQAWGEWAGVPLDELVNRACCQWLAAQERTLGNHEQAAEWEQDEGADAQTTTHAS